MRRGRSPTPDQQEHLQGLLRANQRQREQQRGGKASRRRARAIALRLLALLIRAIEEALGHHQDQLLQERLQQVRERHSQIESFEFVPRRGQPILEAFRPADPAIPVESASENEAVWVSDEEEEVRSVSSSTVAPSRLVVELPDSDRAPTRTPPRSVSAWSRVQITPSNPLLQQQIDWAELQRLNAECLDPSTLEPGLRFKLNHKPIISLDFHLVLDKVRLGRETLGLVGGRGSPLHPQLLAQLQSAAQRACLIVTSYCHAEFTRSGVRRSCSCPGNPFKAIILTDSPDKRRGKLAILSKVVHNHILHQRQLIHIDDSPEVLTELERNRVRCIGIRVRRKVSVEGIPYVDNVFEALHHIFSNLTEILEGSSD